MMLARIKPPASSSVLIKSPRKTPSSIHTLTMLNSTHSVRGTSPVLLVWGPVREKPLTYSSKRAGVPFRAETASSSA